MNRLALLLPFIVTSAVAAQGVDALWNANCLSCHGDRGQGTAQAKSLLGDELAAPAFDRRFFDAIRSGVPGTTMPGFSASLSDREAWGVVVHLRELQARDRRERSASPRGRSDRETMHHAFTIDPYVDAGLDVPWAIAFLPDGRSLITNRSGAVMVLRDGRLTTIAGTPPVRNRGQGGMMEVAPHPDFAHNGWVYLAFSEPLARDGRSVGMTSVVRGVIAPQGDGWAWSDERLIFRAKDEHFLPTDLHFGCRIAFDDADNGRRHLYFSIGERGRMEHAQDLTRPNGKVHRVWDDGSIPDDNPFVAVPDAYPSIWSFGHRNPQGLTFDLEGRLWDTEHGPRGGDELNLVRKGANYGWPTVSYGMNYNGTPFRTPWHDVLADGAANHTGNPAEIVMPVDRWMPSIGACGLDVVDGPAFPKWKGDLLAGGLSGVNVDRIRIKDGAVVEREEILYGIGRVRDVACGPDGLIYVILNDPNTIVRLMPTR